MSEIEKKKPYKNPVEDKVINKSEKEWEWEQKNSHHFKAYQLRKANWEAGHPGRSYESRPRFNTRVWRDNEK